MLFQIWEYVDEDGGLAQPCFPAKDLTKHQWMFSGDPEPRLIHEFEAKTWNEMGQKRYDFHGWGAYPDLQDGDNVIFPEEEE